MYSINEITKSMYLNSSIKLYNIIPSLIKAVEERYIGSL